VELELCSNCSVVLLIWVDTENYVVIERVLYDRVGATERT